MLWLASDKARVSGCASSLMPMVAEEKVTFAESMLRRSADGGAAILAPSMAARRPVAGLAEAAAGFLGLAVSQEMLAAVAGGDVALSSPGVTFWGGSMVVVCGSAEFLLMLGGDVSVLCSS